MYAFQNGFHHEKGYILFLKLGIAELGHHIPCLVTYIQQMYHSRRECYQTYWD